VQIKMVSPPDAQTGLQISRSFSLMPGSSRINMLLSFRNASQRPVRWSIWDVIQLDASRPIPAEEARGRRSAAKGRDFDPTCVVTAPVAAPTPDAPPPFHVMFGEPDNPQWRVEEGLFVARYQWQIGKVGIRSPGGWVAFNQGSRNATFVERFAVDPAGHYPDGGATVECWTVGAGQVGNLNYEGTGIYLMEAEVLSPLQTIEPGREVHFAVTWGLCRSTGRVLHTEDGGCSVERLHARRKGDGLHLAGRFGLFDAGTLEVEWIDGYGRRLGALPLHTPASPAQELTLDVQAAPPVGAAGAELWVRTPTTSRRVDGCRLP
jgi:hypothetical protein